MQQMKSDLFGINFLQKFFFDLKKKNIQWQKKEIHQENVPKKCSSKVFDKNNPQNVGEKCSMKMFYENVPNRVQQIPSEC